MIIIIIVSLCIWYGIGLLGSKIFMDALNREYTNIPPETWRDPFYWNSAIAGPVNLVCTLLIIHDPKR